MKIINILIICLKILCNIIDNLVKNNNNNKNFINILLIF